MFVKNRIYFLIFFFFGAISLNAQVNDDKLGAWYMYFWNTQLKESTVGFQGDIQYRNWNLGGDLEQLLLRGGITYTPKNANIRSTWLSIMKYSSTEREISIITYLFKFLTVTGFTQELDLAFQIT